MSVVSERKNSWSSGEFNQFMSNKTLPEQLVFAFNDYEDYIGSTYQKHVRLTRLHSSVSQNLNDPRNCLGFSKVFPILFHNG